MGDDKIDTKVLEGYIQCFFEGLKLRDNSMGTLSLSENNDKVGSSPYFIYVYSESHEHVVRSDNP